MYGIINKSNNAVTEVFEYPKTVIIDNIKHPKDIFNIWSWEQLNAIGIYQVKLSDKPDIRFYIIDSVSYKFNSLKKNITPSYKTSELPLDDSTSKGVTNYGLKTKAINDTKSTANRLISRFNWLVERSIYDSSKTIPDAVKSYVESIRADSDAIETAIKGATTMKKFKALYQDTYKEDGSVDTVARINRWTNDKTVKEYLM